jgi:prepilin-type N-terminal cleavage/methylation domain-containing protein
MRPDDDGFSLIEVMVAFTIMAGAIIMTFQVFGDGLRSFKITQTHEQEMIYAQHEIDQLSLADTLGEGVKDVKIAETKLHVTITRVKIEGAQNYLLHPFLISVFRSGEEKDAIPLLETILIAKSKTP